MRRWTLPLLIVMLLGSWAASPKKTELSAEAWMLLGNQYYAEGALDAALFAYKQAVEKAPTDAKALYGLGRVQLKIGLVNPAIENLKRALALDAGYLPIYLTLARAYLELAGQAEDPGVAALERAKALSVLKDAERLAPDDPAVYNQEGVVYQAMGRRDKAIAAFKKALAKNPGEPTVLYNLAMVYLASGKLDEAIAAFEKAVKANPKDPYLRARYGALLAVKGDYPAAQKALEEAVLLDPTNSLAWNYLGQVRLKLGDLRGAIAALKKAVELKPIAYPEAYFYLGQAYLKQEDPKTARFYLTKAVVLAAKNADYHYWLGKANEAMGDLAGARAQYQEALKLDPEHAAAKKALARVAP